MKNFNDNLIKLNKLKQLIKHLQLFNSFNSCLLLEFLY